jgi:hypothetical protein
MSTACQQGCLQSRPTVVDPTTMKTMTEGTQSSPQGWTGAPARLRKMFGAPQRGSILDRPKLSKATKKHIASGKARRLHIDKDLLLPVER